MPRDGDDSPKQITPRGLLSLPPGRHHVEGLLHIDVKQNLRRYWVVRFTSPVTGRQREMGIGAFAFSKTEKGLTLKEARQRADALRLDLLVRRVDPLEEAARAKARCLPKAMTFEDAAKQHLKDKSPGWRPGYARNWLKPVERHAYRVVRTMAAAEITVKHVRSVIDPLWTEHPDTAWQVLTRMRAIIDSAAVAEERGGAPNPATWVGHLQRQLPSPTAIKAQRGGVQHQPAMAWSAMPNFWRALMAEEGVVADCLRMTILTAVRPVEARLFNINAVDEQHVWNTKTKTTPGFDIPLCRAARGILQRIAPTVPANRDGSRYLFQGERTRRVGAERLALGDPEFPPIADRAMLARLTRMKEKAEARAAGDSACWHDPRSKRLVVVHGMRAVFRTWATRGAGAPKHLAELVLSHKHANELEDAYDRETEIEARLALHEAWAEFLETGKVRPYSDYVSTEVWKRLMAIAR